MKKVFLWFSLVSLLFPLNNAFAYSWYWGTDSGNDYVADYSSGSDWIALPFTVVPEGFEWVGASLPVVYYTGSETPGHWIYANSTPYLHYSLPKITQTTYIPDMYFLTGYLPDGSYTDDGFQGYSDRLGFQQIGTYNLNEIYPSNNFIIRIGEEGAAPPVVPEPSSLLLLGLGGLLLKRRKKRF